jgi:flagellar hook-associated protein 2
VAYIDGMASGLDTTGIIQGLMQVERIPMQLVEARQADVQRELDAWATIRTKTGSVRTAADALASTTAWQSLTATSSSDAVAVSASTGAASGALSFTVDQLAAAEQRSSTDTFASLDADLGGRTLVIDGTDANGDPVTYDSSLATTPPTTLGELVTQINDADLGVTATALQVTEGSYRLVLTAGETGTANTIDVSGTGWTEAWDAGSITRVAADAQLSVGGITITRSSNTIDDLIEGATITLRDTTTDEVTVSVARDVAAMGDKVEALVEAVNAALSEVDLRTGYDAENSQASSLTGNTTASKLGQELTRALVDVVGADGLPSLAGVELDRTGSVSFDRAAFEEAFAADPAAVEALFTASASGTNHVSYDYSNWRLASGTYDVQLTKTEDPDNLGTYLYAATIGGTEAEVTVEDDGSFRVAADTFDPSMGGLTVSVAAGADAELDAALGTAVSVGEVTYTAGVAERLSTATNRALDAVEGYLTSTEEAGEARIDYLDDQIASWERRLDQREESLRRQFSAMETALSALQNQSSWLSQQLSQLGASSSLF